MRIIDYLQAVKKAPDRDHLAGETALFLSRILKNFCVIKHTATPAPFSVIADFNFIEKNKNWQQNFFGFSMPLKKNRITPFKDVYYIFLNSEYGSEDGYFLISANYPDEHSMDVITSWQALDEQLQSTLAARDSFLSDKNANLVSQLLHDTEAIMQLIPRQALPVDLEKRLVYQKKLNANLLFYLREPELLKEREQLHELIRSALQIAGLKADTIPLTISPEVTEIDVDAELFARALNEVVNNALFACKGDLQKIQIQADIFPQSSPLLDFNWLRIRISNAGPAIPEDFLLHIKEPFFTTHKQEGLSGFGLSIADKIFKAHNGFMEINSSQGSGVTVIIYLPLKK